MIMRFLDICRVDRVGHLIPLLESAQAQCANLLSLSDECTVCPKMRGPETLNIYELFNCTVWWTSMDTYSAQYGGQGCLHHSDCHFWVGKRYLSTSFREEGGCILILILILVIVITITLLQLNHSLQSSSTTFLQLNYSPRNDNHSHHSPLTTFQANAREGASHPEQQAWKEKNLMALVIMMTMLLFLVTILMSFKMRVWFSPFLERAGKQLVEIHMAPLAPWTRQTTAIIVSVSIPKIIFNIEDNCEYQRKSSKSKIIVKIKDNYQYQR